ncbi:MAG TPA: elongation factor G [Caulobacteraceae bacterium]|nr:elongation factor G [Caulobacteraceae bacterium]
MTAHTPGVVRAVALVGPTGVGKTTLMEALVAGGAGARRAGARATIGDASVEAKARGHSVEINVAGFEYMDDRYAVIDCPGAVDFAADGDFALPAVDLAIVVADPDPAKAVLLQPTLRELERLGIPRMIFVNKIDQAQGSLTDLIAALSTVSSVPVVARQLPIRSGDHVTGYLDLALERAFAYHEGQPSERVPPPPELADEVAEARFHMLEQLADFDDELMEKLLSDETPDLALVFSDLVRDLNEVLVAPVLFGDAQKGFGVRRLLKAIRHDVAAPTAVAERLGAEGPGAYVFKTSYAGQAGKLAYARILGSAIADGADFVLPDGTKNRAGGLFSVQGGALNRINQALSGDVIAIAKIEQAKAGQFLSLSGTAQDIDGVVARRTPAYSLAISAKARQDDVKLSSALARLIEEDPALSLTQEAETHQSLLSGQSETHLQLTLERLKRRFGVDVAATPPTTPYLETVSGGVTQHARHKKQTGGHGQFGDVTIEIKAQPRGSGFAFNQRITGGVVPRQWIPAVEQGVRDAMGKGPLGFPVVDVAVTLTDGGYHPVDSSEMAFRLAGRAAMDEGLRRCSSHLLEPIERVTIQVPTSCTSSVTSLLSAKRGQVLGFQPREDWKGWDTVEAYLPKAERYGLIGELRSLSQGLGSFEFAFDHLAEISGRLADDIVKAHGDERRVSA